MDTIQRERTWVAGLHWPLLMATIGVALCGIYNLHSAAEARDSQVYVAQTIFFVVALTFIFLSLTLDYRFTEIIAYPVFIACCVLLVLVLFQGRSAGGATRWISIGSFNLQPSEPAKLATILCLARYFSHRIPPRGFSFGTLFHPLNLSRPLVAAAALALSWNNPFLIDPVGEMARLVRAKLGNSPPEIGDGIGMRIVLCLFLSFLFGATVALIFRLERHQVLLNPWPPGRRRRWVLIVSALFISVLGIVVWNWQAPLLRDPFGYGLLHLYLNAAEGGRYFVMSPSPGLRMILAIGVALYLIAALFVSWSRWTDVETYIAPVDLLVLPAVLILVEPDLGTAGILLLIGMTMILIVGMRARTLITLAFLGVFVATAGWFGVMKDYQKRRIITLLDPEHDLQGAGWHVVQSMIAVGSGRWVGKGHREGTQTQLSFLPEQHTDFAFSVWGEEQGLLGCTAVLLMLFLMVAYGFYIARHARETYGMLLATGVTAMIMWQAVINTGMVIGVLPVVGVTLPLFSYGGSSLISVMVGVGFLLNIHLRRKAT